VGYVLSGFPDSLLVILLLRLRFTFSPMNEEGADVMGTDTIKEFSTRDWCGILTGIGWGLLLGYFFKSDNMTGPWLVVLLGPPLILLISPGRPILSWQIPVITATIFGTIIWRSSDDTIGSLIGEGLVIWLFCSLFSSPWALIFRGRIEQAPERKNREIGILGSYVVVGILVFLACALITLGFVLGLYQVSSADPSGGSAALYSFLMVTGGVGVSIVGYQLGRRWGVGKPVREILDLILGLGSIGGTVPLIVTAYFAFQPSVKANRFGPSDIYSALAILETIATIFWLARAAKHEKRKK
jgi:hypothetical protein